MLLRRSGEIREESYNLAGVTSVDDGEIGVAHESLLLEIAEAVYAEDTEKMAAIRTRGAEEIGAQALVDAIAVAAAFNGITKVANATGIPLDTETEKQTPEMRQVTGIDDYSEAHKSSLFG